MAGLSAVPAEAPWGCDATAGRRRLRIIGGTVLVFNDLFILL